MQAKRDPIIAQATAVGKAGIGVVRISGEGLNPLLRKLFDKSITPRFANLIHLRDENHQSIDQGLLTYFPAPHSFTGEDVIEFHGHGGVLVMNLVIQRFIELGQSLRLRLAKPGEFSERAFLNNKIDLAQAEAIADLIDANSIAAIKSANRSLSGVFSKKIDDLVEQLTHLRMLVEATLDFPEEEIEFLENANASKQWQDIHDTLKTVLHDSQQGALLKNGALVVLAGAPNVGKSSLLNQLAQQDIAIVTPIAGTTRDRIREEIYLDGIPLHIIDTAGLRESHDEVEKMGIERSWSAIGEADIILFLRDASKIDQADSNLLLQEIYTALKLDHQKSTHLIEVWNKKDQVKVRDEERLYISAKTGDGIENLKEQLLNALGWEKHSDNVILARQRHLDSLNLALNHVLEAHRYLSLGNASLELFAEELRLAQDELGEITGKLLPDELLGKIFSSFCIGK
ncbi:tRNA modification GTPase MnmE [Polynucleobacter sp. SHI8]|uniref:tRNA uridine-5-carboxymethylaminomethyl(34) synthesis GTPase MnmE n=1 Tax=unclassified Polynucleobacter TaxID=2640945 RepID=UPI00248FDBBB|nr:MULTISPECIES: tRNA uridine-5-carboxymethylaminomethyl(34) synthesis GTPase MnmE [unclassified Polynucleobacter]BDW12360.1 tRNA modification GTPase MnmE [Polynucleobacter sp. SHI2]BDW14808.1 tRNA modification GTPase MnmE [Polynucleobacter sp. SHI8]